MIQCRLRELMAIKSRRDQRRITYSDIVASTEIRTTTFTRLARDRSEKVALTTVDRLCAYFDGQPGDLFVHVSGNERGMPASAAEDGLRGHLYSKKDRQT